MANSLSARVYLVAHLFLSFVICNADRINLSVAIMPMGAEMNWSSTTQGVVQAWFFVGYLCTQIPAGRLADRIGGRRCLAIAVAIWSILTALTPPAALGSLPLLYAVRAALGLAEGFAMPSVNAAVATWVPVQETARALSFVYSGMYAGSIFGLLVSPYLLVHYHWSMLFYVFGGIGLLWALLFFITTENSPEFANNITPQEREYILANAPASRGAYARVPGKDTEVAVDIPVPAPSLTEIFSRSCVWAIITAHFCQTWGYFVLLTWLPSFLHMRFGVDVANSSILATAPWVAMFVAANVGGVFADWLLQRGVDKTRVRKIMQSAAFVGPSAFLFILSRVQSVAPAVACVAAALAAASLSNAGVYSNHQDIGPRCAGTLLGVSNTFASIPGIVGVAITGVILDHTANNWAAVFNLAIAFYALGFVVFNLFATAELVWP